MAHGYPTNNCLFNNSCPHDGYPKMIWTRTDNSINNTERQQPYLLDWIHISVCVYEQFNVSFVCSGVGGTDCSHGDHIATVLLYASLLSSTIVDSKET